jgi:hypothetical protein
MDSHGGHVARRGERAGMNTIDVAADIDIAAAPTAVAAVMFDPSREPEWVGAVTGVTVIDAALAVGARVEHRGRLLGRELSWTTTVEAAHFPHLLALRVDGGPFVGVLRYEVQRTTDGSRVRIRGVGEPAPAAAVPAAMLTEPMGSALAADLARLKAIVEAA